MIQHDVLVMITIHTNFLGAISLTQISNFLLFFFKGELHKNEKSLQPSVHCTVILNGSWFSFSRNLNQTSHYVQNIFFKISWKTIGRIQDPNPFLFLFRLVEKDIVPAAFGTN